MTRKQIYWASGVGIIYLLLYYLPFFILGENSYLFLDDNMDSEVIFNILSARFFWDMSGTIPELMNVDVRVVNCFSLFQLLFYAIFPPFWAFMVNDIMTRALAYLGMYLVMNLIFKNKHQFISITTAIIFSAIPFFSVYGLTIMGIPLLAWAMWKIFHHEKLVRAYLTVFVFGISSALFLSGYFIIAILGCLSIYFLCKKEHRRKQIPFYIATALLIFLYMLTNIKVISLMLSGYESHRDRWNDPSLKIRERMGWNPIHFVGWMCYILFFGHIHSRGMFSILIAICVAVLVMELVIQKKTSKPSKNHQFAKIIKWLFITNIAIAFLSTFLYTQPMIWVFQMLGLHGFAFQRTYHLITPIWYVAGGVALAYLYETIRTHFANKTNQERSILFARIAIVIMASTSFLFSVSIRDWKPSENYIANWKALFGYQSMNSPTWAQFYNQDIYSEIAQYIETNFDMEQHEYRVGSVALYPMIAVFNGFHTIDGYVQNYSREYWYEFRRIIAPELDKCPRTDAYFNWGNKCYLFVAELPFNSYMFHKDSGMQIRNLNFNTNAFTELGGRFILSGVPIINHATNGLVIQNGGMPFVNDNSWYKVYLYYVL